MTHKIMELADAYGNALFEQALNMRTVDEAPEKAREALAAEVERVVSIPMKYRRMEFNAELQAENAQLREQIKQEQADYHMKCNELELIHDQLTAAQSELANANTVNKAAALEIVELRGKRVALSDEWIRERCSHAWVFETVKHWVKEVEVAHGIGEEP